MTTFLVSFYDHFLDHFFDQLFAHFLDHFYDHHFMSFKGHLFGSYPIRNLIYLNLAILGMVSRAFSDPEHTCLNMH